MTKKPKPAPCSVTGCLEVAAVAGKCKPHYDRAFRGSAAAEVVGSLRDGSLTEAILLRTTPAILRAIDKAKKVAGLSRSRLVHRLLVEVFGVKP